MQPLAQPNALPRLLTVAEVAALMRVSTMTVYRLIKAGDLAAIRVGKSYRIKEDDVDAFIAATRANHEASVGEPGNRRFDVLQAPEDATRFILYEAYASAADAAAHKETAHYLAWRDAVAGMMAEPRRGEPMNGLFPA